MSKLLSDFRQWLSIRLPSRVMRVIRPFLTVQFVIFLFMGFVNTVISISVATLLDLWHENCLSPQNPYRIFSHATNLNFIIGYATSIVTSFFLNSYFTFKQKPTWERFIRFPISYIPNFLCQYIFVLLFTLLGLDKLYAYICAAVVGTPMTFVAMKLIVFRTRRKQEE